MTDDLNQIEALMILNHMNNAASLSREEDDPRMGALDRKLVAMRAGDLILSHWREWTEKEAR